MENDALVAVPTDNSRAAHGGHGAATRPGYLSLHIDDESTCESSTLDYSVPVTCSS